LNIGEPIPGFDPKLTTADGLLRYTDGRVSGLIDLGDGWAVIYEWSSSYRGQGHTVEALTWLREQGVNSVTAFNMGMPPAVGKQISSHAAYWLRMKELGLVQVLIDDDGMEFSLDPDDQPEGKIEGEIKIPDFIIETYTCGSCMYMAAALHRMLSWPITALLSDDTDSAYIEHAWAEEAQRGLFFDIDGCRSMKKNSWVFPDNVALAKLSEDDLFNLVVKTSGHDLQKDEWNAHIDAAIVVAEQYFRSEIDKQAECVPASKAKKRHIDLEAPPGFSH
jgi:hypothetical protein